jgi:hypothetical protein
MANVNRHINTGGTQVSLSGQFNFNDAFIAIPAVTTVPAISYDGQAVFVYPSGQIAIASGTSVWALVEVTG